MNLGDMYELAMAKLNDDPRNTYLLQHIERYVIALEAEHHRLTTELETIKNADRKRELGQLAKQVILQLELQSFESL
ncbi:MULTISPECIES: hypothetical protein [Runella]|uniref:Uncharacterized protein n=1 Tax=Runella defluvii TaxID=370973 RepID=A0A7W5ZQ76_9BACT|nr:MULTISPECIES: hypothetical protein [Runella]MBB3840730.1 hypothetical protein [Runella defluvii]